LNKKARLVAAADANARISPGTTTYLDSIIFEFPAAL
jgi:hypothetical protein